ncbi:MAG: choice-of-anchor D domain-containing protein [Verrucomicrobiaceae bacterium]|nr:MAG: choice-of-anchor D domain-containing protein [Verrucomicrobiaceae bacterium]
MITWRDGRRPATGRLSESNSMTDTKAKATVLPLANGHYVVSWSVPSDSPPSDFPGAVTWADGRKEISGKVTAGNSILYTAGDDSLWRGPVITSWPDSAYAVLWRDAAGNGAESAGAMVLGNGYSQDTGKGAPNFLNSVRGESRYNGPGMNTSYDAVRKTWAVGSPRENRVSLFSYSRPAEAVVSLEEPGGLDLPAGSMVDFGLIAVGESQERTVTIINRGGRSLRLEEIILDDPQFRLLAPPAASELAPGGGTSMVLRFTPASPGTKSAVLHLPSDDPAQPVITLTLRGTAKASAEGQAGSGQTAG